MRVLDFERLGEVWFAATEEELDTVFIDAETVDAERWEALPKADPSALGELRYGVHTATVLFFLGVKMKRPEMTGVNGQVMLYKVPAKAEEALAKRVGDAAALADEWTARARAEEPNAEMLTLRVSESAARELAALAVRALERDAWLCAIIDAG
jgi:hypothetical protein